MESARERFHGTCFSRTKSVGRYTFNVRNCIETKLFVNSAIVSKEKETNREENTIIKEKHTKLSIKRGFADTCVEGMLALGYLTSKK